MNFLAPLFFAGLAAVAVPVLIHLINRERKVVVEFPSLMFLQKIPYRSVRRQRLRHLLLLLLRCLAIAIIVLAFARPFLDRDAAAVAGSGAREVVIAVDRSYSMGYGTRWTRAVTQARDLVRALAPGDRATIVLFDDTPTAATEPTSDKVRLERALASATLGSQGTRYAPAIKLGAQVLGASQLPRRELVLISDFQQRGWASREELGLPTGATMRTIDVSTGEVADAAVTSVTTDRDPDATAARVTVAARVTNVGTEPRQVQATLELASRPVETRPVEIPARGSAQVRFAPVAVPRGATAGMVAITGDSLPQNDRFHFTVAPDEAVSVLIIEPSAGARASQSLFLRGALGIVERPSFRVDVRRADALTPADLDGRALVVLNEAAPPTGALGTRLRSLVDAGAGLLVVPGEQPVERWSQEWRDLLPVTVGPMVDRSADAGATIGSVDYSHPLFETFSAPRSGDFASARVFRYRMLTARGDSGIVARFDDGRPAMVLRNHGSGRIAVWATSIDQTWTDLPLQPVFVPFAHQLGRHVARFSDARPWFVAGDVLDLSRFADIAGTGAATTAPGDTARLILQSPSGERSRLTATGEDHLAPLREHGFYELRGERTPVGSGRPIAVNVDPAESDLSHLDPATLVASVMAGDATRAGAGFLEPTEQERRQTIWWYLLLLGLLLLAIETVWSNRLSRTAGAGAEIALASGRPPLRRV